MAVHAKRGRRPHPCASAIALVAGGAASSPRLEGCATRGASWFETAQERLLTMRDAHFRAAKYATRQRRFVSCALAPRVECWLATPEESQGSPNVRLAIRFRQEPRP